MRTGLSVSLAAGVVALAVLAPVGRSHAATLPGATELPVAAESIGAVADARTVCRRWWNGYRWRTRCYWVPGRYWGPRPYRYRPYRYYRW
jgi:hypothetical protein